MIRNAAVLLALAGVVGGAALYGNALVVVDDPEYVIDQIYEAWDCDEWATSCAWIVDVHAENPHFHQIDSTHVQWHDVPHVGWISWECSDVSANGPWHGYIQGGDADVDAWWFETEVFDPNATAWIKVTLSTWGFQYAVSDVIETVGVCEDWTTWNQ